jgi:DNA invertase Pin-like site-specific DNA recombinase
MIYGYTRVSTDAQDLAIQLELLRAAGCEKVFHDKEAGDSADRPQLKRLMKKLSAGDVVKAPATDRFARDPTDLLVLGRDIRAKGARLVSIAEPIVDTDSEFWELVAGAALSDGRLDCSGRVALEAERSDASSPGSEAVDQGDPRERRCGAHM